MITCNFCGNLFSSCEDFEKHIDSNCPSTQQKESALEISYQVIYQNGKSELKKVLVYLEKDKWIEETTDEFLHGHKTDEDFTGPQTVAFFLNGNSGN